MKLIAFTIFCLVITETITGTSISGPEKHPETVAGNNATTTKNTTDIKFPVPEPTIVPENKTITSSTTTSTTTNTTTTTPVPTPPSNTTTVSPPTTTPSPSTPNVTTAAPVTTPVAPTDSPAHKTDRKFDSFSFIAGIVMAAGLMAIGLVAFKFYEARRDRNYHTI
ncbi:hypothetical protein LSTR_LSTR002506 [Laodelphax striatellus]|uniref:Uncharacterized protein n=1 Tax=Laodelphax striatellus TaxID=195883 RepID=A0A482X309_LAOST|nr:hypothetical protein LSTR_LSTR002506 [Laodelphax striatellus]